MSFGFLTAQEVESREWQEFAAKLFEARRATVLSAPIPGPSPAGGREGRASSPPAGERSGEGEALYVAAERLPEFLALFPDTTPAPRIEAPEPFRGRSWTPEDALVEILRDRMQALGPVNARDIAASLALPQAPVEAALARLEAEGAVMRGRFTPGAGTDEWCERRLLARIHRYTLSRLRREIEPVEARDFLRFLLHWQRVATDSRGDGPDAVAAVVSQLEGYEAAAAAWETEILPARVAEYDPAWLDELSLAGRVVWLRLTPPREAAATPVRSTPIALLTRRSLAAWASLAQAPGDRGSSARAGQVADCLRDRGASFFDEIVEVTGLLRTQVEEALAELAALGLVNCDSFGGLRALLVPSDRRRPLGGEHGRRRRRTVLFGIEDAGRWSLLRRPARPQADAQTVEQIVRSLLKRYGVVFWRLLEREAGWLPPWRDLLRCCRRLEARGEIRGGRFVAGFSGEQFALPEAVGALRESRRRERGGELLAVSGADPLNLVGILTPGPRLPALTTNRVLYRDGVPVALLAAGDVRFLEKLDAPVQWQAHQALLRRPIPAALAFLA